MVPLAPIQMLYQPQLGGPARTALNIGGATAPGYRRTYQKLFGHRWGRRPLPAARRRAALLAAGATGANAAAPGLGSHGRLHTPTS
jgi:hypothetical protein